MEENVMNENNDVLEKKGLVNIDLTRIVQGLVTIANCDIDDFDTNSIIAKNITAFSEIEKVYTKTVNSLMKKHIMIDPVKNVFMVENNSYVFKSETDRAEYESAYESLVNTPVKAKVLKIKLSQLKKATPTVKAITLAQIHEFIEDDITDSKS